jgi:hypothetical protein
MFGLGGYINLNGKFVLEPKYDKVYGFAPNGLASVILMGKAGAINERGIFVVPPLYDMVGIFSNGFAWVELDDKYGYVNDKGELITDIIYEDADRFASNGLAAVKISSDNYNAARGANAAATGENVSGYIDSKGNFVIEPKFYIARTFSDNGLAMVNLKKGEPLAFINERGDTVITPQFEAAYDFGENGLAYVKKDGNWTYVNAKGELLTYKDTVCGKKVLKNFHGDIIWPKEAVNLSCK